MINKVTINGLEIGHGTPYRIIRGEGFGIPEQRIAESTIPLRHRKIIPRLFWGGRRMALEVLVVADTPESLQTLKDSMLYALDLPRRGRAELIIDSLAGTTVRSNVQIPYPPMIDSLPGMSRHCLAGVSLLAQDPTFYSNDLHSTEITDSGTVSNAGDVEVYPTIRLYGAVTNPLIQNLAEAKTLSYVGTILDGDYIEFDCENETAIRGSDGANALNNLSGDFWGVIPGDNSLVFSGSDMGDNAKASIQWRDGFRGFLVATLLSPGAIDRWDWILGNWDSAEEYWDADIE